MTQKDIENKQIVFIKYLQEKIKEITTEKWKIKAEYSTNDNNTRVIIVQEQVGQKVVFFGDCKPLYNYYMIDIYGNSIQECKNMSLLLGDLIGQMVYVNNGDEVWQIIFAQFSNPQAIEYLDIKRVGYNMTIQCVVNRIK